jgi:hypothetical protein
MSLVQYDPLVSEQGFEMAENYGWLQYEKHHERDDDWGLEWPGWKPYKPYKGNTYTISII